MFKGQFVGIKVHQKSFSYCIDLIPSDWHAVFKIAHNDKMSAFISIPSLMKYFANVKNKSYERIS